MSHKNPFALLDEDGSDDETTKVQSKPAPAPAPAAQKPKQERKPRAPREDSRPSYDDKGAHPERQSGKGGDNRRSGKGKGNRKGDRASSGDSGRDYPRRSGTGRGREVSKQGGGKYGWGKEGDQSAPDAEKKEGVEAAPAEQTEPEQVIEEEPEEDNMSLEEYEKLQAEKLADLNNLNAGRGGRVVERDDSLNVLERDEVEDQYSCMFHDPTKEKKHHSKKGRSGAKQADQVLNLKYVDEDSSSGHKGKGDRRGGKGDGRSQGKGDRRGPKGGNANHSKPAGSNIDLSNNQAFPTLGA